jgi:hypothetical protein
MDEDLSTNVELSFSVTGWSSKNNTQMVIQVLENNQALEYGRTEIVENDNKADFVKSFIFKYNFESKKYFVIIKRIQKSSYCFLISRKKVLKNLKTKNFWVM